MMAFLKRFWVKTQKIFKRLFGKEPSPWGQPARKPLEERLPKLPLPRLPSIRLRIPYLRKLKRILAGILLFLNILTSFMGGGASTIIFLGTAFILLDYLYKTRRQV